MENKYLTITEPIFSSKLAALDCFFRLICSKRWTVPLAWVALASVMEGKSRKKKYFRLVCVQSRVGDRVREHLHIQVFPVAFSNNTSALCGM